MNLYRTGFALLVVVSIATVPSTSCRRASRLVARSGWGSLEEGDYLRSEYIDAVCRTHSPQKAWKEMEAGKNSSLEQISVGKGEKGVSIQAGYNFHEGSSAIEPDAADSVLLNGAVYSILVENSKAFELFDIGSRKLGFRYVGDWQRWANEAVVAGTYEDERGQKYVLSADGKATFPSGMKFDYNVGLDMILTSYDYIYSAQMKSTWAVRRTPNGISLYDVDLDRNEPEGLIATRPRWKLRRLTSIGCQ